MKEEKLYPVIKRVSLEGYSEGWDDSCYAYVVPSNYDDQRRLAEADIASRTPEEQINYQVEFVRSHFVSGKIKAFNGEGFVEIDMTSDHVTASVDVTDILWSEIMGLGLDPKDIRKAASVNALRGNDSTATETSSSVAEA